jgi:hypothetical protein
MAAHVEHTLRGLLLQGGNGARFDVFKVQRLLAFSPNLDALKQGAAVVRARLSGGEGGVEVNVGFDKGRADQLAAQVEHPMTGGRSETIGIAAQVRLQRHDFAALDGDVGGSCRSARTQQNLTIFQQDVIVHGLIFMG